jgi:hypothetical protein
MPSNHSADRHIEPPYGLAAAIVIAAAVVVVLGFSALVLFVRPAVGHGERDQTTVTAGGLHYSVNNAWVLVPRRPVDAAVARGLPRVDADLPRDQLLYAVFVGVTNEHDSPRPMVSEIALRDAQNVEYAPTRLGRGNAYAYRPTILEGKTHLPAPSTPPDSDLAADGLMLVFRIPREAYEDGPLQLVLHDPLRPHSVQTVQTA